MKNKYVEEFYKKYGSEFNEELYLDIAKNADYELFCILCTVLDYKLGRNSLLNMYLHKIISVCNKRIVDCLPHTFNLVLKDYCDVLEREFEYANLYSLFVLDDDSEQGVINSVVLGAVAFYHWDGVCCNKYQDLQRSSIEDIYRSIDVSLSKIYSRLSGNIKLESGDEIDIKSAISCNLWIGNIENLYWLMENNGILDMGYANLKCI